MCCACDHASARLHALALVPACASVCTCQRVLVCACQRVRVPIGCCIGYARVRVCACRCVSIAPSVPACVLCMCMVRVPLCQRTCCVAARVLLRVLVSPVSAHACLPAAASPACTARHVTARVRVRVSVCRYRRVSSARVVLAPVLCICRCMVRVPLCRRTGCVAARVLCCRAGYAGARSARDRVLYHHTRRVCLFAGARALCRRT